MKTILTMLAGSAIAVAAPAGAQTTAAPQPAAAAPAQAAPAATQAAPTGGAPAGVVVGATVKDQAGGVVGTIQSVGNGSAVVSTGRINAALPFASFASTPTGPIISLTREQLEAQAAQANAQAVNQALRVGATVRGPQGAQVGTIESITGDQVVIATPKAKAQVPKSSFGADATGLTIGETQAQLEALVAAASHGGAAPATGAGAASGTPPATNPPSMR